MDKGINNNTNLLYGTYIKPIYGTDYELIENYIIHIKRIKKEGKNFNVESYKYNESKKTIELLNNERNIVDLDSKISSRFFIKLNEENKDSLAVFQSGFSKLAWDSVIETIEKKLQEKQDNQIKEDIGPANVTYANNDFLQYKTDDLEKYSYYPNISHNKSYSSNKSSISNGGNAKDSSVGKKFIDRNSKFNNAHSNTKDVFDLFKCLLFCLMFILFVKAYHGFSFGTYIDFYNMSPTIENGSWLLSSRVPITLKGISRGDIVVANVDLNNSLYRVVGMPNETIEQKYDGIYINGILYEESYIDESNNVDSKNWQWSFTLGEEEYFLLGDNRDYDSYDSRVYGPIKSNYIIQKVLFK